MLNPTWLHTFKTLIEVGHFTQTAEKLYMTQPGVSQQVKKLELACGYSLIKRENKSFEITEQGRQVYDFALRLASNETELLESLSFDDPYSGLCRLSCSGALALHIYPELLKLQAQHSSLIIHLEAAPNYKILDDIQDGAIDIGVVTHLPSPSLFNSQTLGCGPLCLILPKRYKNESITAAVLKRCGLVKHPDAAHYLSLYFDLCSEPEFAQLNIDTLDTVSYVNQLSQILLPISQGIGFTVLPKSALDSFSHKEKVYIHRPKQAVAEQLYLVQKRNRQLPARYQTITAQLDALIKQSGSKKNEQE
ncbi:transcriptional regulator [Shewanella psychrophila]|uniref:Transcriptional regulator n=1 Tax=Shewanella psychrophila TaxID=225848 RepID=A0A1S6HN02_9GAMM|nr:LysR family transcriptional regulator [Shewanella psychrophila]AQS36911.1 transcriptional regulator [Shewanella psychrophila]